MLPEHEIRVANPVKVRLISESMWQERNDAHILLDLFRKQCISELKNLKIPPWWILCPSFQIYLLYVWRFHALSGLHEPYRVTIIVFQFCGGEGQNLLIIIPNIVGKTSFPCLTLPFLKIYILLYLLMASITWCWMRYIGLEAPSCSIKIRQFLLF